MKQLVIIIAILLCLSFSLTAQVREVCQPDSAKIYFDLSEHPSWHYGEMYTFDCTYDSDGLLTNLRTEWAENEQWYYRRHQYEYDSFHNLTRDKFNGASWDYPPGSQALKVYTYQNNLLSSYANYDYDFHSGPDFWKCVDSSVYQYDGLGRLVRKDTYNGNMQHTTTIHYDYPEQLQTVMTTDKNINGIWNTISRTTKIFSEGKNPLSILIETCSEGVFSNSSLVTYAYTESEKTSEVLTQNWTDGGWQNAKLLSYNYNDNGHLVSLEIKEWQNDGFENKDRAVYEPNEDGYPMVVTFETWEEEGWVEGTWKPDLFVFNESYLSRQNNELCGEDVKRIELHYTNTQMPNFGVQEQNDAQEFCKVFPNPTTGKIIVTGTNLRQAEVLNILGQCVATFRTEGDELYVDLQRQPAGIYFINITDVQGRKCMRKVVKE